MINEVKILAGALMLVALATWVPIPAFAADGCGAGGNCCAGKAGAATTASPAGEPVAQLTRPIGHIKGRDAGQGRGARGRAGGERGPGQGGAKGALMDDAHALVFNNNQIQREIEDLPNGVVTKTTTSNPELLAVLQRHPKDMADHLKEGGRVRNWDPLFAELAAVADEVTMEVTQLENGLLVRSTSENPEVAKLIKAHAYKVSEFVARGTAAMREGTPLPSDYARKDGTADGATGSTPACCQKMADELDAAAQADPHAGH